MIGNTLNCLQAGSWEACQVLTIFTVQAAMVVAVVGALLHCCVQGECAQGLDGALLEGGGFHLFFYSRGCPAAGVHDPQVVVVHADSEQAILTPVGAPAVAPNPVPNRPYSQSDMLQ